MSEKIVQKLVKLLPELEYRNINRFKELVPRHVIEETLSEQVDFDYNDDDLTQALNILLKKAEAEGPFEAYIFTD